MKRKVGVAKVNPERKARLYARNFGEWAAEIRMMSCEVCGRVPTEAFPNEAAHTVARGMGGCGGDKRTLLPLCRACHRAFDAYQSPLLREDARDAAERLWAERGPREEAA